MNYDLNSGGRRRFFAAANSAGGFISYFGEIFAGLNKLYIIKGGPGTGKASLMRDVAAEGENKGLSVEYFYCSSDPSSLDGVILPELGVGVLDGTSPHVSGTPAAESLSDEFSVAFHHVGAVRQRVGPVRGGKDVPDTDKSVAPR